QYVDACANLYVGHCFSDCWSLDTTVCNKSILFVQGAVNPHSDSICFNISLFFKIEYEINKMD
ncbi:hypothetical protein, partial [Streptococcus suis]|uniref:hypothetical protein n=1 Tax=Streptococcus suis TaxID=1307 RepID=UPI0037039D94